MTVEAHERSGTDQFLVSRNIMVLARSSHSWKALFDSSTLKYDVTMIFGSNFARDRASKISFFHCLNRIINAMEAGAIVVLHNTDELYDSLYGMWL